MPKRIYTLEELRLNKIEAEKLLSPADETLNTVRTVLQVSKHCPCGRKYLSARTVQLQAKGQHSDAKMPNLQGAGLLGLAAAFFGLHLEGSQLAGILVSVGFVFTADQVLFCSPRLPSVCQLLMS